MLHWLVTLLLAVFVYRQAETIRRLEARLTAALMAMTPTRREPDPDVWAADPAPAPPTPESRPAPVPEPAPAPRPAPVVAETRPILRTSIPITPVEREPIIPAFRTPADDWSVPDDDRPTRRPPPRPSEPYVQEPRPSRDMSWAAVSTWLAENGLAWLGGGGLALGGLLLVVYAAQQGVFGPPLRIAAAVVLGGLMIAASEWILHQKRAPGGRHLLAAAVAAGAGAVTLYGAVCAAHTLYDMISFPVAAGLTAAISLGLLGLSLRHGESLALLALFGAVITPGVTGMEAWSPAVLYGYALLIGVTGFVLSATRLWGRAGFVTIAGLLMWSLAPRFDGGSALLILAAAGPVCAVLWRRRTHPDDPAERPLATFLAQPMIGLILTCLVSTHLWLRSPGDVAIVPEAALVGAVLVALGAAIVTLGMAAPMVFAVPVGIAVIACLLRLMALAYDPTQATNLLWLHGMTAVIAAATLAGALRTPAAARTTLLAIGGIGLAVLASVSWPLLDQIGAPLPWLPAAVLSAALFASAALLARRVEDAATDKGLVFWLAAAAELAFLAIHAAVPAHLEPLALAGASLVLCAAAGRLNWRGLSQTGVVGGLLTLAVMFRPEFMDAALEGRLPLPVAMAVSVGAAALLYLGARLMRADDRHAIEAQTTAALLVLLTGLFIGLHVLLSGVEAGVASGELFASTMRTLLLLSAGLLLVTRQRADDGPIAVWRAVILVGVGILHGLITQGLVWNPWWGLGDAPAGLPVFNTLILSYLAPAGLIAACAWRRRPTDRWAQLWAAAAALFAFVWALLVVRHVFQGAAMGDAGIGRAEACAYAVLLLLTVRAFAQDRFRSGLADWLRLAAPPIGWIALAFAALTFGLLASPWWGLMQTPLASAADGALIFGLYAAGAGLAWAVSRKSVALGRAALAVAFGVALVLVLHLLRWAFHGPALAVGGLGRAEAAAYAVVGLATARLLLSDRVMDASARTEWLRRAAPAVIWLAMAAAAGVFGLYASPWWGPVSAPLASLPAALLLFALYALGVAGMASLRPAPGAMGKAATAGTVGLLFVLMTLVIRWVFHGTAMGGATPGSGLETWTFSALWAVFGLGALSLGTLRRDATLRWAGLLVLLATAVKVLFFDLSQLQGVVRAASFLVVGALFLAGALAARRLKAHLDVGEAED